MPTKLNEIEPQPAGSEGYKKLIPASWPNREGGYDKGPSRIGMENYHVGTIHSGSQQIRRYRVSSRILVRGLDPRLVSGAVRHLGLGKAAPSGAALLFLIQPRSIYWSGHQRPPSFTSCRQQTRATGSARALEVRPPERRAWCRATDCMKSPAASGRRFGERSELLYSYS